MGTQQPPPDGAGTLGQARQQANDPRRRAAHDLPTLPNWPPLPNEPSRAAWPSLDPSVPDESHPADALQPTETDDRLWSGQRLAPAPPGRDGNGRGSPGAPKRGRFGIVVGALLLAALIVAGSVFALHAAGGLGTGAAHNSATQSATQNHTPGALATVTAHPTRQPTSSPTTTPAPQALTLAFTCASGSLHGTGQVCVHTLPHATLSLTVRYCDGSTARGLHGDVTADGSGDYTWSWQVRTACAGAATATVRATLNGQSLTQSDTFTITK